MGGKARVHELAKEFGVTSKELLARLSEAGEFVKSASSTVEGPVARRLRAAYGTKRPTPKFVGADVERPAAVTARPQPKAVADRRAPRPGMLTSSQAGDICNRYRRAAASENPALAINELFREYEATYGLPRTRLRKVIADDRRRNPDKYVTPQTARSAPRNTLNDAQPEKAQKSYPADAAPGVNVRESTGRPSDGEKAVITRPRARTAILPPGVAMTNLEAVADIIVGKDPSHYDREVVVTCLQELAPNGPDGYGYLTWRYAAVLRSAHAEARSTTAHYDLAALAAVIDVEKRLLDTLVNAHGSILEHPELSKRAMDNEFRDLTDADDIGRSAADELRRARANFDFLRRSVVLTIASPANDQRLWDTLGRIQPPTRDQLVETTPQLERSTERLNDLIAGVERLLTTGDAALVRFFHQSHSDLVALQAGRYDFLRQFHDIAGSSTASRQTIAELAFEVLPHGEQFRTFLDGLRSSGLYRGDQIDEHRVDVLEDLQKHFGADRCRWHQGSASSSGIDNRYLVLAIKSANGSGEDAVAISPLAGRHATYVVRRECAEADWKILFANPKFEARLRGARKLLFTSTDRGVDQYSAMRDKVVNLLECDPREFRKRTV